MADVDMSLLSQLEEQHGLPAGLLNAVRTKESGGDAYALSPKGAMGHFQFMPETAAAYGVDDPTDFKQSATGAAKYLADLKARYSGDLTKTLAAYNAGPTAVAKYNGVPPYPETQNYVTGIMGQLAEDAPPDLSDLPPDLGNLSVPQVWGGEGNARPARDYQKELDKEAGIIEPIVGSIAGGGIGAAIGSGIAPVAGTAVGAVAGGGVGNFIGTLAGISRAEANGALTNIPVEQKLLYAAKQSGIDMAATTATLGVAKMLPLVRRFFKPSEMDEVESFFRKMGVENPRPQLGPMAEYGTQAYKNAAQDMKGAVNQAITDVVTEQAALAGGPTKAGTMFQEALSKAHENVSKYVNNLYGFAKRGTTVGDTLVKPDAKVQDLAKNAITEYKAQNTYGQLDAAVRQTLEDIAGGKGASIADTISMKRGVASATDFKNPDVVSRSLDQKTMTELLAALDATVSQGLRPFPKANGAYQAANKIYSESMSDLRSNLMLQMVKKDPLSVTDYVARNATPTVMNDFENGLSRMLRTKAMTLQEAEQLRAGVRQNWITQNLGSETKATELAEALSGKNLNPQLEETFNYVFRGNNAARTAVLKAAEASAAAAKFAESIPAAGRAGAGAYSMAASAGGIVGSQVGGPVGAAVGAFGGMGLVRLMTSTIPNALAKAAMNNDRALLNQIRVASSWYTNMVARGEPVSQIPAGVMNIIHQIEGAVGGGQ